MNAFGITGLVFFATGAFVGFLVTALAPIRHDTWWLWPSVRVVWQLGGALWAAWGIGQAIPSARGALLLGGAVLGFVLCFNAVFDLVRGPLVDRVTLLDVTFQEGRFVRPTGSNAALHSELRATTSSGDEIRVRPSGMQANRLQRMIERCSSNGARLIALRHLQIVVDLQCEPDRRE